MKRTIAHVAFGVCAAVALVLGIPALGSQSAWATVCNDGTEYGLRDGDFEYLLNPEGKAEITAYLGSDKDVVFPAEIGGKAVVCVGYQPTLSKAKATCAVPAEVESVTISEGISEINGEAFRGFTALKNVQLPNSLSSIGRDAFNGCSKLQSISLTPKLATIGSNVFSGTSIEHLTVPGSVKSIGSAAYPLGGMKQLKTLELAEGITSTAGALFKNNSALESISLPASLKEIHSHTFDNLDPTKVAAAVDANSSSFQVKGTIMYNKKGTKIVWQFGPLPSANLVIPEGITSIGGAYTNRKDVKTVTLPKSLKYLNSHAFYQATALEKITFKGTKLSKVSSEAFCSCTSLKQISLPKGLTEVSTGAFRDCSKLAAVTLPSTIKQIGSSAFKNCTSLKKVKLPSKLKKVSIDTFRGCKKLKSVSLPSGITRISASAFRNCKALKSIKLPKKLGSVGDYLFAGTAITKLTVPGSVKSIRAYAFAEMSKLKSVTLSSGVKSIGSQSFGKCKKLKTVKLPKSLKKISSSAFAKGLPKLAKVKKGSWASKWAKKHKVKRAYT